LRAHCSPYAISLSLLECHSCAQAHLFEEKSENPSSDKACGTGELKFSADNESFHTRTRFLDMIRAERKGIGGN
jgi:hypothetical protein